MFKVIGVCSYVHGDVFEIDTTVSSKEDFEDFINSHGEKFGDAQGLEQFIYTLFPQNQNIA